MSTEDCAEVEVIGWLYQFYISEKKDEVFASKSAVKKEDIPAATQLFTPRWIVEYMVQNTLGKLWLQNRPNSGIKQFMPYYIESPSSNSTDYLKINSVEEIRFLDQASGSGHILVYAFDLFAKIYEEEGYNASEIPQLILENNLNGFEIDERAAQLSGFALMMKARSYNRRFFRKEVKPKILCYKDLELNADDIKATFDDIKINLSDSLLFDLTTLQQATNFGSLIRPKTTNTQLQTIFNQFTESLDKSDMFSKPQIEKLLSAISQLIPLSLSYHCVVDNPPYMGGGNMNIELSEFVKTNYPDSKADLMACFMEAGWNSLEKKGFLGMINQHSWMFTSSYLELRKKIIRTYNIESLLHLGARTFPEINGEIVQNCSFVISNNYIQKDAVFFRLLKYKNSLSKKEAFLNKQSKPIVINQNKFEKIKSKSISYWASDKVIKLFEEYDILKDHIITKQGLATGKDFRFLFYFYEISNNSIEYKQKFGETIFNKFYPYNKGETLSKWESPSNIVISYDEESRNLLLKMGNKCPSRDLYFKAYLTWPKLVSKTFGVRYQENHIFGSNGLVAFAEEEHLNYLLALLCSKVSYFLLSFINPTLAFQKGDVDLMPIKFTNSNLINDTSTYNRILSLKYSECSETEFNFKKNELIRLKAQDLEESYDLYQQYWQNKFFQLHQNEEELNRQFIEIYGLQDELTPDVPLQDITILKEETSIENGELVFHADEVFEQFVSYAVGCMFGRYSLDKEGLILANQGETVEDYVKKTAPQPPEGGARELSFMPDEDNIIPVLDDEWFEDDIVTRFHVFLKASFGEKNFAKNLAFVEDCLGKDVRKYFTKDFYKDHVQRYKKRPIYWMFSSPKGYFNVLVYLHRYTPDTINRILNSYLKEFIEKLTQHRKQQEHIVVVGSATEQNKAQKEIDKIDQMLADCRQYMDILYPLATERIALDLDDGVLVNYNKLGNAVAIVDGLNDKKSKDKVRKFDWIDVTQIR